MQHYSQHIFLCTNQKPEGKTCCANSGGEFFFDYFKKKLRELDQRKTDNIRISKSGCLGRCKLGPCLVIYPEGIWFSYSSFADIDEIINSFIINKNIVKHLLIEN